MDQRRILWEDQRVRIALRGFKLQTKVLEHRVSAWDTQLDMDMEARPSKCRGAIEDEIQASTTAIRAVNRGLVKHLIKVMELVDVKME